jgi:hypothetical protein
MVWPGCPPYLAYILAQAGSFGLMILSIATSLPRQQTQGRLHSRFLRSPLWAAWISRRLFRLNFASISINRRDIAGIVSETRTKPGFDRKTVETKCAF